MFGETDADINPQKEKIEMQIESEDVRAQCVWFVSALGIKIKLYFFHGLHFDVICLEFPPEESGTSAVALMTS